MFNRFFSVLLTLFVVSIAVSACSSDDERRNVQRPANANIEEGSDIDILNHPMPEYVAGTQEDLVAHVGDRIFFEYDSTELNTTAQRILQRQAQWMNMNPNMNIRIEGHADERGTREYNLALGERRAIAAKNYLGSLGINPRRISVISYGKERPVDPDSNDIAWSKNRRAVTVVN